MKIMFVGVCDLFCFVWLQKTGNEEGAGKSMASHWQGQDSKPWLPHTPCSFWLYHSPLHCLSSFPGYFLGPPFAFCHLSSDLSITFRCFGCFTLWWVRSCPSPLLCTLQYHIQPAHLAAQLLFMFKTLPHVCFKWVFQIKQPPLPLCPAISALGEYSSL